LTKESMKENNFLTKQLDPREFPDWGGEKRIIQSKELRKSVFAHGLVLYIEAETSDTEHFVECPIQTDPTKYQPKYQPKYQRLECSKITDQNAQKLSDKIVNLATSTEIEQRLEG